MYVIMPRPCPSLPVSIKPSMHACMSAPRLGNGKGSDLRQSWEGEAGSDLPGEVTKRSLCPTAGPRAQG